MKKSKRSKTISDLAKLIETVHGPRCPLDDLGYVDDHGYRKCKNCRTCTAWMVFDAVNYLTTTTSVPINEVRN